MMESGFGAHLGQRVGNFRVYDQVFGNDAGLPHERTVLNTHKPTLNFDEQEGQRGRPGKKEH